VRGSRDDHLELSELLREGFGDVDAAEWDHAFVFFVQLWVILVDESNEFVAINEL